MSATPEFTEAQLRQARQGKWRQGGEPLLTLEDAKAWIADCGLVLFAPQPKAVAAPAPSLVEATLGAENAAPGAAESETARGFVSRLTAEGAALPLNLLGGPGDAPDFIVSAQVFPYIFTLRGDKGWKQPPSTSGAVKVSPLSLKVYEALSEHGAMTAAELVSELGREVTEAAIVRALGELWGQLRVIPLTAAGDAATSWELTTKRFTKAIKTGANAGQPTALSALISLYLAGVFAATEEEITTFLSPLTARSRVRDVLHGLTAGRQMETVAVEGKTLLYIAGALPAFAVPETLQAESGAEAQPVSAKTGEGKTERRIRRFDGERPSRPRPGGGGAGRGGDRASERPPGSFRGKPRPEGDRPQRRAGPRREFGARDSGRPGGGFAGRPDRERRPFQRKDEAGERPAFTKPWNEDRDARRPPRKESGGGWKGSSRQEGEERSGGARGGAPRPGGSRPSGRDGGERPAKRSFGTASRGDRPAFDRPRRSFEASAGPRSGSERPRPARRREEGDGGREGASPRTDRGPRREGFVPAARSNDRGPRAEGRPKPFAPRRDAGGTKGFGGGGFKRAAPAGGGFRKPRPAGEGGDERRPPAGRSGFGASPSRSEGRPDSRNKPAFSGRPPFKAAGAGSGGRPGFKGAKPAFGGKPGFKSSRPPSRGGTKSFGSKGGFGGKGGSSARPAGGPRENRPAPRKPRPEAEE